MNIHVDNLSLNIIEDDLQKLFAAYGSVVSVIIVRSNNGRSKGAAFIDMPVHAQGKQAIAALNNMELDGKRITVHQIEYRPGEFNN